MSGDWHVWETQSSYRHRQEGIFQNVLGQKSCRTKVPRIFRFFVPNFFPEFCSEFSPNFLRSFHASFRGKRRPEKIHQKSPPFFNAKFPGKDENYIHKIYLESRQSKNVSAPPLVHMISWKNKQSFIQDSRTLYCRTPEKWFGVIFSKVIRIAPRKSELQAENRRYRPKIGDIRGGFWQNGFFPRIFIFGPPDFSADFVGGFFLLIFVGKGAQKNPPGKSPGKILQKLYNKNPRHISAEGLAQEIRAKKSPPNPNRIAREDARTGFRSFWFSPMNLFFGGGSSRYWYANFSEGCKGGYAHKEDRGLFIASKGNFNFSGYLK